MPMSPQYQRQRRSGKAAGVFAVIAVGLVLVKLYAAAIPAPARAIASGTLPMPLAALAGTLALAMSIAWIGSTFRAQPGLEREEPRATGAATAAEDGTKPRTWQDLGVLGRSVVAGMALAAAADAIFVVALGFIGSYETQRGVAQPALHHSAWMVPVIADAGAVLFIALEFLLAFLQMPMPALRIVTIAWLSGTVGLNIAGGHGDPKQILAHLLFPAIIIIVFHLGGKIMAHWARQVSPHVAEQYEPLPKAWWILRPVETFLLWRRRTLLQLRTIDELLEAQARYQLAKARAQEIYKDKYKVFWWRHAPQHVRWVLRYDQLDDQGLDAIRRAVSKELWGGLLSEVRGSGGGAPPPKSRATSGPRPTKPAPAIAPNPTGSQPPPAPGAPQQSTLTEQPTDLPADWPAEYVNAYLRYERHRLENQVQMRDFELAEVMGLSKSNVRNIRLKFYPVFQQRNGFDPKATGRREDLVGRAGDTDSPGEESRTRELETSATGG